MSGGGTVYHDEGNLNYTIMANDGQRKIDYESFSRPIIEGLEHMGGVIAKIDSRNSITVDGFKICGHAQYIHKKRTMHHGCLLFDSDLSVLEKALMVSKDKVKSKSVKSVRSRVKNISDFLDKAYNMDDFKVFLLDSIRETYGCVEEVILSDEDYQAIEAIRQEKFTGWDWVYGKSPAFNLKRKRIISQGDFEVRLQIKHGCIKEIHFFGDFFGVSGVDGVEQALHGTQYNQKSIKKVIERVDVSSVFQVSKEDFLGLIIE